MKDRKAKPLRTELITCISITVCGMSMNRSLLPSTLWQRITPFVLILGIILCVWMLILDWTKGTEAELEREEQDERNLMILDRASWFCWRVENVLLITAFAACILFLRYEITYAISCVLYWIIILRYWLLFAARWWMNRKY